MLDADADQVTHDEPEIEATRVNQEALQDIPVTAQMRSHTPGVIEMRERAFDPLAALAHQVPAASSPNPATIAIHQRLASGASDQSRRPRSGSATYERMPTALKSTIVCLLWYPLSANNLLQRLRLRDGGLCVCDLVRCGRRRFHDGRRVAGVGALQRDGDHGAGLQVDRMLGFVGQVRATIFHLGDLRVGVVGIRPVLFEVFLFRLRSSRAKSSRVGVSMPDAFASPIRKSRYPLPCHAARCCASRRRPRA